MTDEASDFRFSNRLKQGVYDAPLRVTSDGRADRICELSGDFTSFEEMRAHSKRVTFVFRI